MILMIDNFDSFTYNIFQYLCKLGNDVLVKRNNEITIEEIEALDPTHIIVSPGPGNPETAGVSVEVIKHFAGKKPIMGVCLGHQSIGHAFGGDIVKAKKLYHGKTSSITHNGKGLFKAFKSPYTATRYHSLVIDKETIPDCLEITATSEDGEIMGVKHKEYDIHGVQYHPESIASEYGYEIFTNFLGIKGSGASMKDYINKVVEGNDLTQLEAESAMDTITSGDATPVQIASFLTALRMKGEVSTEITGFAKVMREKSVAINKPEGEKVVDIVGTGGDKTGTFNISTTSAFVVAGAGLTVAKHGNRSVTSKSGAADVLESLGVKIDIEPAKMQTALDTKGISFLFAPRLHPSMKYAVPVRRDMGIRTVFNILGPLTNPAAADYQVIGVFDEKLVQPMAEVLMNLGVKGGMVVHGHGGLDEFSLTGPSKVAEIKDGWIKTYEIDPKEFGFDYCSTQDILGGEPEENSKITMSILEGDKGPKRDIVVLNAATVILTAGIAKDFEEAIKMAQDSIDSGRALGKLKALAEFTPA